MLPRMVGDRLRELRAARGVSLRQLGAETGLSATLLSQVERGVTDPSLKSLRVLADYFGQSVATLFEDVDDGRPVHITTPGERSRITSRHGRIQYSRVTSGNGALEVLLGVLGPGEVSSEEPWSHEATECAYVLSGTLVVEAAGEQHTLEPGHAVTLSSSSPHRYLNTGGQVTEFLLSVTPPTP